MENIGRKSGWKTVFSTIWQKMKNTKDGKPGRKFSLPSPQISFKKWTYGIFTQMPSGIKLIKKKKKTRNRERALENEAWNVLELE